MLRIILNVKRNENNIPLMRSNEMYLLLNILKFDDILDYFYMCFLRKILNNPDHLFYNMFLEQAPNHDYAFRHFRFLLPYARTNIVKNSTFYQILLLYNNLPDHLKISMSKFTFKLHFKKYILEKYGQFF